MLQIWGLLKYGLQAVDFWSPLPIKSLAISPRDSGWLQILTIKFVITYLVPEAVFFPHFFTNRDVPICVFFLLCFQLLDFCCLCEIKMVHMLICFLFSLCRWNCQVPHPYLWVQGPLLPVWTLRPFAFPLFLHMIALSHGKDLITWYDWLVFLTVLLCAITLNRRSELQDWPFCLLHVPKHPV